MICVALSEGRTYPMNRPKATKTSEPAHTMSAEATQAPAGIWAWRSGPRT